MNATSPHNSPTEPVVFLPRVARAVDEVVQRTTDTMDELDRLWIGARDGEDAGGRVEYQWPAAFKLSIVIPVYNEAATIRDVIARVQEVRVPSEIIVVDDCSTDGTRQVLESLQGTSGLRVLCQPCNEGKGAALRTGFEAATGDVVVVQDADLEYDPQDLPAVIWPIVQGEADVVYGSRFLDDRPQDPSFLHRLLNRVLTGASNFFTGLRLTDMETCYKAFRREVLADLPLCQNRFGFEPEVTAKLARRYRIAETPVRYRARSYAEGKKIGLRDAWNALYCIVRYGLAD